MAARSLEILKAVAIRGGVVSRTVEEGGIVRMRILIKKQDLEQVMKKKEDNKENRVRSSNKHRRRLSRSVASKSLKTPVDDSVKMKVVNDDQRNVDRRSHWRPALQSIPEEF